jgi:2-hydroxyglutarate dehydrogenase
MLRKIRRGSLSPQRRLFCSSSTHRTDFTHAVVGGGVVGLAIAQRLQERNGASTVLIERHGSVGTETSSRNSEVREDLHGEFEDAI